MSGLGSIGSSASAMLAMQQQAQNNIERVRDEIYRMTGFGNMPNGGTASEWYYGEKPRAKPKYERFADELQAEITDWLKDAA